MGDVEIRVCNLLDKEELAREISALAPRSVIHLAGISSLTHSNIEELYETNIIGARNLLNALVPLGMRLQSVVLASSATIYGNTGGHPLDETTEPAPANDYAVSRLAMEYLAKTYVGKLPIHLIRPFNYTGRGQTTGFVIPKIVEHFKQRAPFIELGNIDVIREFSDVRRIVNAYARILSLPGRGEIYNLCSGVGVSLREIIAEAERLTGYHIEIRINPSFIRENEVDILIGSCAKVEAAVGSLPKYTIKETLSWMLEG
jgi:nucleoside-diphosphate-sugar epimerase